MEYEKLGSGQLLMRILSVNQQLQASIQFAASESLFLERDSFCDETELSLWKDNLAHAGRRLPATLFSTRVECSLYVGSLLTP